MHCIVINDNNTILYVQSKDNVNISVNNFSIYDRWGNLVFTRDNVDLNNPAFGWDGYIGNNKVQSGVYVYRIEYLVNGELHYKTGGVSVVY